MFELTSDGRRKDARKGGKRVYDDDLQPGAYREGSIPPRQDARNQK